MSFNIFRIDWLLIDSIISIILVIILIGVNILKKLYRWRFPISNENLKRIPSKQLLIKDMYINKSIRKWALTYPKNNYNIDKLATIFICRTFRKSLLLNALTEGLSSYGFTIINVWFRKQTESNDFETPINEVLSKIIEYNKNININISKSNFILVYGRIPFKSDNDFINFDNLGVIILNPKLMRNAIIKISEISKLYGILSEKYFRFIRNPYLKKILKLQKEGISEIMKITVIKRAGRSFRYYETILLGELIKILKSNSNN